MTKQATIKTTLAAAAIETAIIVGLVALVSPVAAQITMVACGAHLLHRLSKVSWGGRFVPKS